MKKTIYITTLLTITACLSTKEKAQWANKTQSTYDVSNDLRYGYTWQQVDSFGRWWHFQTDSSFRYHADSGITAGSGSLWLWEKGSSITQQQEQLDQRTIEKKEQTRKEQYSQRQFSRMEVYWLFALLAIGVVVWLKSRWRV